MTWVAWHPAAMTDYVTGIHVTAVPARGSGGRPVERRTPHAVPRDAADRVPGQACCGADVQEVHPDVPFPPGHTAQFQAPACLECQARV